MTKRFESISCVLHPFEFLYNFPDCYEIEDKELKEKCRSLEEIEDINEK